MLNHIYKDLYNKDSVRKSLLISYDGGEITNKEIYSESMVLKERLCTETQLKFGCCETSELTLKISNIGSSLKGKWLEVKETLENQDTVFRFGKYKVFSDVPSANRNYRQITAYDLMYDVINADVSEWYKNLEFPIKQKDFRDSFFNYLGIIQKTTSLIHDDMMIEKTIDAISISGKEIITSLCELNGVFGHINREDNFEYISLNNTNEINVSTSLVKSGEYEDFVTSKITKLQIRQEENDIGIVYGEGNNCYIIQDNIFVYGKSSEELSDICSRLYQKINGISYRPYKAVIKGNPCYMVGDRIAVQTKKLEIFSFIFERTLSGIQALSDTIVAEGVFEYQEDVNSFQKEIIQLKGKTNTLERNIDETRSEIKNVEEGLSSEIKQMAGSIKLEVKAEIQVGSVNLLRNSKTLDFEKYYFRKDTIQITLQPKDNECKVNDTVTFTVNANSTVGNNLYYQWKERVLGSEWTDIEEGNSETLVYTAKQENTIEIMCVVTDTANDKKVTRVAVLVVNKNAYNYLTDENGEYLVDENNDKLTD